ncbi:NAD(P)-binding domain-containing protein [Rufibacter ruber]|uniref:NAD(P)-binding domain-containing protein n=1 Tax=Rufibacter ruber TaxID=1783499 RepID=UPI0008330A28|nr:NAD(P)-binding domain-containing protein [Rufibacter ruber]
MKPKKIAVLGCGWLGLPLAQELVKKGYRVNGSTTTPGKLPILQEAGIQPFLLSFPENSSKTELSSFLEAETLVFNLPPSKSQGEAAYEQILQTVLAAAPAALQHLLFVSSTSVYPDLNREVVESDAIASPAAASLLLRCEYLVQHIQGITATVVRFGGLMGRQRHPGRWLAGKKDVPLPEGPVNMIHLTDCVQLLTEVLAQEKWGETYNACAPLHPIRQEFYTAAAAALALTPPAFAATTAPRFKQINSDKITADLAYRFHFPDPVACLASIDF